MAGPAPIVRARGWTGDRRPAGALAGIVEEAYLALRARQPLYVAGGLGGVAARVADALQGDWPEELTTDYQRTHTTGCEELLSAGVGTTDEDLRAAFGSSQAGNCLDAEQNELLSRTADLDLIVMLRGLTGRWCSCNLFVREAVPRRVGAGA
jgi:hypothetical protein